MDNINCEILREHQIKRVMEILKRRRSTSLRQLAVYGSSITREAAQRILDRRNKKESA